MKTSFQGLLNRFINFNYEQIRKTQPPKFLWFQLIRISSAFSSLRHWPKTFLSACLNYGFSLPNDMNEHKSSFIIYKFSSLRSIGWNWNIEFHSQISLSHLYLFWWNKLFTDLLLAERELSGDTFEVSNFLQTSQPNVPSDEIYFSLETRREIGKLRRKTWKAIKFIEFTLLKRT